MAKDNEYKTLEEIISSLTRIKERSIDVETNKIGSFESLTEYFYVVDSHVKAFERSVEIISKAYEANLSIRRMLKKAAEESTST